jgi:hypothetical protein
MLGASAAMAPLFAADSEGSKAPCEPAGGGEACEAAGGDQSAAKPETVPCGEPGEKKSVFVNGQPFIIASPAKPCPEN